MLNKTAMNYFTFAMQAIILKGLVTLSIDCILNIHVHFFSVFDGNLIVGKRLGLRSQNIVKLKLR